MKALSSLLVLAFALATGVASADDEALSPQQQQGKRAYNHICVYCHSPGVWGTNRLSKRMDKEKAVLENRTDLSAALVQTVVRTGIGSMPLTPSPNPMPRIDCSSSRVSNTRAAPKRCARPRVSP